MQTSQPSSADTRPLVMIESDERYENLRQVLCQMVKQPRKERKKNHSLTFEYYWTMNRFRKCKTNFWQLPGYKCNLIYSTEKKKKIVKQGKLIHSRNYLQPYFNSNTKLWTHMYIVSTGSWYFIIFHVLIKRILYECSKRTCAALIKL